MKISKKNIKYSTFLIEAKGIKEIIYGKRYAYDTYDYIREIKLYMNEPGTITLKFKNDIGKWELLNKTTINKDFFNNKPVGYKK